MQAHQMKLRSQDATIREDDDINQTLASAPKSNEAGTWGLARAVSPIPEPMMEDRRIRSEKQMPQSLGSMDPADARADFTQYCSEIMFLQDSVASAIASSQKTQTETFKDCFQSVIKTSLLNENEGFTSFTELYHARNKQTSIFESERRANVCSKYNSRASAARARGRRAVSFQSADSLTPRSRPPRAVTSPWSPGVRSPASLTAAQPSVAVYRSDEKAAPVLFVLYCPEVLHCRTHTVCALAKEKSPSCSLNTTDQACRWSHAGYESTYYISCAVFPKVVQVDPQGSTGDSTRVYVGFNEVPLLRISQPISRTKNGPLNVLYACAQSVTPKSHALMHGGPGYKAKFCPTLSSRSKFSGKKNRDLKAMLAPLVEGDHTSWAEKLPMIRFALSKILNYKYVTGLSDFRPINDISHRDHL
ncbi:hypothetical protein EVAR_95813_1 [Eumeta japonica]|uniref:Uncharacterized protein n=1 Tax=Eumeta variegata TaxID=151549 RepID=A0A4C1W274_EUMVA|nr:hypothetical protein EVAR_95813_1 [Eumeta japonica]